MMTLRRSAERGRSERSWLRSQHSFSFGEYHDPQHMGVGPLRVINEDRVAPGGGFATHSHRDMEILSYVLTGALQHQDSLGNGSVIRPGDVQRMSAGTGVAHSEYNPSSTDPAHFLQIWIVPRERDLPPSYEQRHFDLAAGRGQLRLVASPDGREGSVIVHQGVDVYAALLDADEAVSHALAPGRRAYVQVARGEVTVNGERLVAGDGVAIEGESTVVVTGIQAAEVLLFDL